MIRKEEVRQAPGDREDSGKKKDGVVSQMWRIQEVRDGGEVMPHGRK